MAQHNYEDLEPSDNPSTVPPLSNLPVITPSILSVLITQWQSSATNRSTLTLTTTLHTPIHSTTQL